MIHQHNLERKQQRAEQQHPFAAGQGQGIVPRQAQQVKPRQADAGADSQFDPRPPPKEHPQQRYQHHIQRRQKARLGRAGGANADLLCRRSRKQRNAAEHTAPQQHPAVDPERNTGIRFAGLAAAQQNQHDQKCAGQPAAGRQKGIRPHIAAAHTLRHKGCAPDQRPQQKQQGVAQLFFIKVHLLIPFLFQSYPQNAPASVCVDRCAGARFIFGYSASGATRSSLPMPSIFTPPVM